MKKKTILFMTVGTGYGKEGKESLSKGLSYSITENHPNYIVFFATEQSKETVDMIRDNILREEQEDLNEFSEIVHINEPDEFKECYDKITQKVKEYYDENIILDYTSGTKTMSVSMAIIGVIKNLRLIVISGDKENGTVKHHTEVIKQQNLYKVYDEINLKQTKQYFNLNRFDTAQLLLDDIVSLLSDEDKEMFQEFIATYEKWDKFNHDQLTIKSENPLFGDIQEQIQKNQEAIKIILKETHGQKDYYILADLLNNARRRYEEGKYDDAVARLYRSLEYIAQIRLEKEYGQTTKNIDIKKLENYKIKPEYIMYLENKNQNGLIKLALRDDYRLLNELNDDLGEYFEKKEKIYRNVLNERNDPILAHGINPTNKSKYEVFEQLVLEMAERLTPNMETFLEKTKFPKFKV